MSIRMFAAAALASAWAAVPYSASAVPTAPDMPTGVTAIAGVDSGTISWTAPSDGGDPITSYVVTPYIGSTAQTPEITTDTIDTMIILVGLTAGTSYTATVTATNAVGTGPSSSPSNAFTPTASLPSGAPGPIAGAGLPGLIAACGGLLALGRRRRQSRA